MAALKSKVSKTLPFFSNLLKWLLLIIVTGVSIGAATAFFLISLNWVTDWREGHLWIIAMLPLGGLAIGFAYHYWGAGVVKGNNLLIEEYHSPNQDIPFRMAPLVLFGTLVTHLFGGSAGREGTAVQMGGAIADKFSKLFKISRPDRGILLVMGISAGFAAVFGTPWAGAVFALEVMAFNRIRYYAVLPSLLVAFVADYACRLLGATHTHYTIPLVPALGMQNVSWALLTGMLSGLAAWLFSNSVHLSGKWFGKIIPFPPLRPFLGGLIIALSVWLLDTTAYIGLGIPTIVNSFQESLPAYVFLLKILLTAITLGSGFKGGEVTPLFFVGAAMGSALSLFVPLPVALLAGMGFVAVFSGATHTPVACTLMGMELFGAGCGIYIGIACTMAYFFSGNSGIYTSQVIGGPKAFIYEMFRKNF